MASEDTAWSWAKGHQHRRSPATGKTACGLTYEAPVQLVRSEVHTVHVRSEVGRSAHRRSVRSFTASPSGPEG